MWQISSAIRTLLMDHLATAQALIADTPVGGTVVKIANTSRFKEGDELWLMSSGSKIEPCLIRMIPDDKTIILDRPTVGAWAAATNSLVQKTLAYQPLKRIHIGDLRQIPSFPTITIVPTNESNEWMTLGSTSHEYRASIRTYVLMDNFEKANEVLMRYTEYIREILVDHIRPIITGDHYPLLEDLPIGGKVVKISDTTAFADDMIRYGLSAAFLRDNMPHPSEQEDYVKTVLSPTELELAEVAGVEYKVSRQAEIIRVTRLLYDSRPESISYGYVPGENASLMLASEITWFAKEQICRSGNIIS